MSDMTKAQQVLGNRYGPVVDFIKESNKIEGIIRDPTVAELDEATMFLDLGEVMIGDLERFVMVYQPGATMRTRHGMNVYVGNHVPPRGGPAVLPELVEILDGAAGGDDPYDIHVRYETLHPFMDGNGRSGRMLWAWQMVNQQGYDLRIGFLHMFYYQALGASR